jgi:hypothetical protein
MQEGSEIFPRDMNPTAPNLTGDHVVGAGLQHVGHLVVEVCDDWLSGWLAGCLYVHMYVCMYG